MGDDDRTARLQLEIQALSAHREALLEEQAALEGVRKQGEALSQVEASRFEQRKISLDIEEKILLLAGQSTKAVHKKRIALEKEIETQTKSNAAVDEGAKKAADLTDQLIGVEGIYAKLTAVIPKSTEELKGFASEIMSLKTITKAGHFVLSKFVNGAFELGMGLDATRSAILQSTGASYAFASEIGNLNAGMMQLGLSQGEAAGVGADLYAGMSAFTQLSKNERIHIANVTAALTQQGMAAGETAKIMDIATRSLYMSGNGAVQLALDFKQMGEDIGLPASVIAQDFAAAAPELAKYGSQMIDVFIGLEKQAKQTGISTNRLIGIAAQFDQFDKAGEAVGRLNAIMGGPYLNSIDMLNMKEDERIEAIRRTMDMAGMQFDTLHRFEQQAIALALGMNVDEARRVFGMTTLEYERQTLEALKAEKQAKINQAITDKLRIAFLKLGEQLLPVVNRMIGWAEALANWLEEASPFQKKLLLIAGILAALAPVFSSLGVVMRGFHLLWRGIVFVFQMAIPLIQALSASLAAMALPVWAVAAAVAATGFAAFAAVFTWLEPKVGKISAFFYGLAAAVLAAAIAFALLTGGISWGLGLAAVAGSVGLAAVGAMTAETPKTAKTAGKPKGPKVGDMITDDDGNVRAILNERDYLMAAREGGPILGGIQRGNAEIVKHLKVMNETLTKLDLTLHLDGEKVGSSRSFNKGRDNYLNDKYPPTRQA